MHYTWCHLSPEVSMALVAHQQEQRVTSPSQVIVFKAHQVKTEKVFMLKLTIQWTLDAAYPL